MLGNRQNATVTVSCLLHPLRQSFKLFTIEHCEDSLEVVRYFAEISESQLCIEKKRHTLKLDLMAELINNQEFRTNNNSEKQKYFYFFIPELLKKSNNTLFNEGK